MIEIANDIVRAAVHPLTEPTGWQAFAYGLLGLKMVRKSVKTARSIVPSGGAANTADTATNDSEE